MRRRIRLTGRRELKKSVVRVSLAELGGKRLLTMTVAQPEALKPFPTDAKVSLRLIENKRVEVVELGTIGKLRTSQELRSVDFVAPSCQLRIADPGSRTKGLLLASTDNWTLRGDDEKDNESSRGILLFLADETTPQSWKLDVRESDYPLVRIDNRIPNAALWARHDPVFVGTALPTIVRQVFDEILREEYSEDTPWVVDWLRWAESILPAQSPPLGEDRATRLEYLERLVDSFCARHNFADNLLEAAKPEEIQ
jgi:hypothetical protein